MKTYMKRPAGSGRVFGVGWEPVLQLGLLLLGIALSSGWRAMGTGPGESPAAAAETNRPPCCRKAPPAAQASDQSIYLLDSEWTSDVGRRVKLSVFRGRPQVVALFFSHCEFACPVLVHDMKRIEAGLPESVRGQVDFLLVSIDPERDVPRELAAYRKRQGLPVQNWSLLTGATDDVRELAAMLGVSYRKDSRGQYAHSNLISVLNAEGEVVHRQVGLNVDPLVTIGVVSQCARDMVSK